MRPALELHTFTSGSRTLSYQLHGSGPLVVMLPGGPGLDPPTYFADSRLPGFQQLVFCPRGTGRSDPPATPEGYRIAGYVQDLDALRDHIGASTLTLCGSSHGASTALAYAAAHPDHVDRMILAGGPARMDEHFTHALTLARTRFSRAAPDGTERLRRADAAGPSMRTAVDEPGRRRLLRTVMDCHVAHPGPGGTAFLDRLCAAPVDFASAGPMGQEMTSGLDLLRDADRIRARALVLAGDLDVRVPTEHLHVITDAIAGARLTRFPGVGHLIHAEARERWAQVVAAFLAST